MTKKTPLHVIAKATVKKLSPRHIFRASRLVREKLCKSSLKKYENIIIISVGKAAAGMTKAVTEIMKRKPKRILLADSGHPFPTQRSLSNTRRIIEAAKCLTEKDLAIVLISGGGSAMLESPASPMKLNDLVLLTQSLLRSGASIQEINVVRKHFSEIKGGKLAKFLYPATVWGFVISDVPGSDLSTIASGPISPDTSTVSDAIKILNQYKIRTPMRNALQETPKPREKYFRNVTINIIADHHTALNIASQEAEKRGYSVYRTPRLIIGEAREAAERFLRNAQQKLKKYDMVIAAGETTVTCRGKGAGGRNQEFVLSGLRFLKPGQTLLSIGTDGCDGLCPETVAGAMADCTTLHQAQKHRLSLDDFLQNNDSYHFFKKTGGSITTGPTGTNLGDLILLLTSDIL